MCKDTYINYIIDDCSNNTERVINILKARGFLIDNDEDGYYILSDNSHKNDVDYLCKIFETLDIGTVLNEKIIIDNNADWIKLYSELFNSNENISGDPPRKKVAGLNLQLKYMASRCPLLIWRLLLLSILKQYRHAVL